MIDRLKARPSRKALTGAGYTITEVLIVLAVSSAMFAAIVVAFSGRQARVEFTQAVRNFEAQINNIIGDVSSGFYQADFGCTVGGSGPIIDNSTPGVTGTNEDCIFLGKIIVPNEASGNITSDITTVVGRRQAEGVDVENFDKAQPVLAGNSVNYAHSFRLEIRKIVNLSDNLELTGVGFMSPLSGTQDSSGGEGLVQIRGSAFSGIDTYNSLPDGAVFCLQGQNGQKAEISVGAGNSQSTVFSVLDTNPQTAAEPCYE